MADRNWRTNPSIQQAKAVAQATGATRVVMLLINDETGTMQTATYGKDGPLCTKAGAIGDFVFEEVSMAMVAGELE